MRHAEQGARFGRVLRLGDLWNPEARCWEMAAEVDWDEGWPSWWPLRDLVLVRRPAPGEGEEGQ